MLRTDDTGGTQTKAPSFLASAPPLSVPRPGSDRALTIAAVERAVNGIPPQDPLAAQKILCETLALLGREDTSDPVQLQALIALDGHARLVCDRLLERYVDGDAQLRLLDRKVMVAAIRLCQSMALGFEYFLGACGRPEGEPASACAAVIVHLFYHRQVEFLLRFFRFKKRNAEQWLALHDTYRFALERGLHRQPVRMTAGASAMRTPEQQYIQILLLEVMNGGQFSPREALWAYNWFARWCTGLALDPTPPSRVGDMEANGFEINLSGSEGPTRPAAAVTGHCLYFDPAVLQERIDDELAALAAADPAAAARRPAREGQRALLIKLKVLFARTPTRAVRRGERESEGLTVQTVVGLPAIVRVLREAVPTRPEPRRPSAALNEATIGAMDAPTRTPALTAWGAGHFGSNDAPQNWQIKDRSDSGCRMRGKTADLNRVIPGSLIACRAAENAPWSIGTVRRLRRLMVDHVEIGVEYMGSNPRFVKMVADHHPDASVDGLLAAGLKCFGALYMPPSERFPVMPIKTLLLPAREFRADGRMTLLASNAVYALRLNEPIQRQFEFVWTSFTIVDRTRVMERASAGTSL